jgi:hypothetical protein
LSDILTPQGATTAVKGGAKELVISNPYTRVCFRLGDFDAKKLEDGLSFFRAKDLQNLGVGEAICRMERAEYDFNLTTNQLPPTDPETAARTREKIVVSSREPYATGRCCLESGRALDCLRNFGEHRCRA